MIEQDLESIERKRRINVLIWAYGYEFYNSSVVPDSVFDDTCKLINLDTSTGNKLYDDWFKANFDTDTGQWIHKFPDLDRIKELYLKYYN